MAKYRFCWRYSAIVLASLGLVLSLLTNPTLPLIAALCASAGIALCIALGLTLGRDTTAKPQGFASAFSTGFSVVLILALFVIGAFGLLVIWLVILATSPEVVSRAFGSNRRRNPAKAVITLRRIGGTELSRMSMAGLVREWRHTYVQLHRTDDPATMMALVDARARYLDELERRDPVGLHQWLVSRPLAVGDPTAYMLGDDEESGPPQAA